MPRAALSEEARHSEAGRSALARVLVTPAFARLWLAQALSSFGARLTGFTLPVVAVVVLDASPLQMSLLVVFQEAPVLVFTLFVGVWMDRAPIARILLWAALIQTLVLLAASIGFAFFPLGMLALYLVALVYGVARLAVDLSFASGLPALLEPRLLVAGNSRFQVTRAAVSVIAPAVGGALTRLLFPPLALLAAGASGLALSLTAPRLSLPPAAGASAPDRAGMVPEIRAGLGLLFADRHLRPLITSSCLGAFATGILQALLVLTLIRSLSLDTATLGLVLAAGGAATVLGALASPRVTERSGMGRALILGNVLTAFGFCALATSSHSLHPWLAVSGLVCAGLGGPLYNINQVSIRQAVTPRTFLGRVNASRRFVVFSFVPAGALAGAQLAEATSLSHGLYAAAAAMTLATAVSLVSPLRHRFLPGEAAP